MDSFSEKLKREKMLQTKNIIISGTNFWNPGDDFVRDGVIRILHELFPDHILNFLFYNFNQDFYPQSKFKGIHNMAANGDLDKYKDFVDYIVIAGLSAGDEIKDLYKWIIDNHLTDRVYLIGAGYENEYVDKHIYEEPELTIFKNAKIITSRTKKAPKIINKLGLSFHHINCPAILSVPEVKEIPENKKIERVAFSIQLPKEFGVSNQACSNEMYLLAIEILTEIYGEYEIEVIAHHKSEYFHFLKLFKEFNLDIPVIFSSFYQDLFEIYKRNDLIVTTRLHASLFANGFGIPGIILNDTDRHTHCLEGFPHSVWVNSKELFFDRLEVLKRNKLSDISVETKLFKDNLLKKYIKVLSVAFGVGEQSSGIGTETFKDTKTDIERYVKKGASSLEVKKRVLNNFQKLEQDYWLGKNIEAYQKTIEDKNESSFDLVSFLNWYAHEFKPESYFEIGVRRGRSMCQIISESSNTEIVGMDLWIKNYSSIPEEGIFTENPGPEFVLKELKKFGLTKAPNLFQGDSRTELVKLFNNKNNLQLFDLIVVDGDHTYEGAKSDLTIMFEHLKEGGVLVFDDITHPSHRELRELWEEFKVQKQEFIFIEDLSGTGTGIAIKPPFTKFIKTDSSVISDKDLPIHFFTIVLNGKPFIEYHINVFKKLPFTWHWHIVEGVADLKHDTAWSLKNGAYISDELHNNGLSNDGTTEYIDSLKNQFPQNITIYRKEDKKFWNGKLEMVNAPLKNIKEECILWEIDADELWTQEQLIKGRQLYLNNPDKTASYYFCSFYVGEKLLVTSTDTYGNHTKYEWIRSWRYKPADQWISHEPPALCRKNDNGDWIDLCKINSFPHSVTRQHGLIFQHFAYVTPEQLIFKEKYYGYNNALNQWKNLQSQTKFPLMLKDYCQWVKDDAVVEKPEKYGLTPLAVRKNEKWIFSFSTGTENKVGNILYLRPDSIGDNILSLQVLEKIQDRFPDSEISVLCQDHIAELYTPVPFVNEIITFNQKSLRTSEEYKSEFEKFLSSKHFDLLLNPVYSRAPFIDFLAANINASKKIAFSGNTSNMTAEELINNNVLYSDLIESEGEHKCELLRYDDLLKYFQIPLCNIEPTLWVNREDEKFAEDVFLNNNFINENTIALFAGAQYDIRLYEHYGKAIKNAFPDKDINIIALGSEKDISINDINLKETGFNFINLSGKTSIRQAASIIRRCLIAVGAETGLAHIACSVGTPNVILLGGGHFGRFMPYSNLTSIVTLPLDCFGCDWKCKYKNPYCVNQINHTLLTQAIQDTIKNPGEKPRVYVQKEWNGKDPNSDALILDKFLIPGSVEKIDQEIKNVDYLEDLDMAEKYIIEKKYEEAKTILQRILLSEPENTYALNDSAVIDIYENNWERAFSNLSQVLRVQPTNETALNNLKILESELMSQKNYLSSVINDEEQRIKQNPVKV
jgi:ADP-heptose:LPS heptosyltransferase/predicted O-methyltransferase YrrM